MKRFLLIYEEIDVSRNRWFIEHLGEVGATYGLTFTLLTYEGSGRHLLDDLPSPGAFDGAFNRGRSSELTDALDAIVAPVVNPPTLTALASDKVATKAFATALGLDVPELLSLGDPPADLDHLTSPIVGKDRYGHGGSSVRRIENGSELAAFCRETPHRHRMFERYVPAGSTEVRAYIIGRTATYWVEKQAVNDFRSNLSQGGSVRSYTPSIEERSMVATVVESLPPGIYGIDLMRGGDAPLLSEIEDPVGFRALYKLGLPDPAARVCSYLLEASST